MKRFELHTDNASLQWLQQQRHVSHHQARWLNLLAQYKYNVVHIQGSTNPADLLTRKRFPDGPGPALFMGYDESDSALELFTAAAPAPAAAFGHSGQDPSTPRFLHADFASAVRAALPQDSELGPLTAAAQAASGAAAALDVVHATKDHRSFLFRDGLLCDIAVARVVIDSASQSRAGCSSRSWGSFMPRSSAAISAATRSSR